MIPKLPQKAKTKGNPGQTQARPRQTTGPATGVRMGVLVTLVVTQTITLLFSIDDLVVELLTLKGYDATQIAKMRKTAPGTARAQLTSIYGKSDSNGRGQIVSLFIDALLDDPAQPRNIPD